MIKPNLIIKMLKITYHLLEIKNNCTCKMKIFESWQLENLIFLKIHYPLGLKMKINLLKLQIKMFVTTLHNGREMLNEEVEKI